MNIIHQQNEFVVVEKPSGLTVHNDPSHDIVSLLSKHLSSNVFPIHRLDKGTSGLLLCTTQSDMVTTLQESLLRGTKQYQAIVRGVLSSEKGDWRYSITDTSEGRRNPRGKSQYRKKAHTGYELVSANQYLSLISLTLCTGRQHQIRKHCVLAGHEIVGDTRYGDTRYQKKMKARYGFDGIFLHAQHLKFSLLNKEYIFSCDPIGWGILGFTDL